jgi:spermidine synthase
MSNPDSEVKTSIINNPAEDEIRQIEGLYRQEGWWQAKAGAGLKLIPKLIAGSHCFVVAVENNDIVGMGRAVSDGASDAYIQDLVVRKDRRRRGIGRQILDALIRRLQDDGIRWIALIAKPGSHGFYRKEGFDEMPSCVSMLLSRKR